MLYLNILACGFFLLGVSGIYFLDYFLFYIFVNGRKTGGKRDLTRSVRGKFIFRRMNDNESMFLLPLLMKELFFSK